MDDFIVVMSPNFHVVGVEMPWSYYGHRGILDLALRSRALVGGKRQWVLCEMKPELLDVGEAIRQVKKVRQYFLRDEDRKGMLEGEASEVTCPLVLLASEFNLVRCMKYYRVLRDIDIVFFSKDSAVADAVAAKYEIFLATRSVREAEPAPGARWGFIRGGQPIAGELFSPPAAAASPKDQVRVPFLARGDLRSRPGGNPGA